jgi:hypothetical protein
MILTSAYDTTMGSFFNPEYSNVLYIKPWARFGTYFIGVVLGMMYFEHKNSEKITELRRSIGAIYFNALANNRTFRYACYLVGFAFTFFAVFV